MSVTSRCKPFKAHTDNCCTNDNVDCILSQASKPSPSRTGERFLTKYFLSLGAEDIYQLISSEYHDLHCL
jgi:hypothetical protein